MEIKNKRQQIQSLVGQLKKVRTSFESQWKELGDLVLPAAVRLNEDNENQGHKKYGEVLDSTATISLRTLSSGMMGGLTSPSRPWFKLDLKDDLIKESEEVKQWLHKVTVKMAEVFSESNIYNVLAKTYQDVGLFATSTFSIEEDLEDVIRGSHYPIGEYWIAQDHKGRVNTFYREFKMTVQQIVEQYGMDPLTGKINWTKLSPSIKDAWESGNEQNEVRVGHLVYPNKNYSPKKISAKFKKFLSCTFELNHGVADDIFLKESGFDYFPVLAPRWSVYGNDVYGTDSPGMLALGDVKQLQYGEKKKLQGIEKKINPPMVGSTSLQNQKVSIAPGDTVFEDTREGQRGFRPAHEVNISLADLIASQEQVRTRIREILHENTFRMISNLDRANITAREIAERREEKLLVIGPVLEQLNKDLLNPLIDITFDIMLRQGRVPEPPKELAGKKLKVEYKSIMEQAQKAVSISTMERFYAFVTNVMRVNGESMDKIDFDEFIDLVAADMGIPPTLVRADDKVEKLRAARAAQQQKLAQAQAAQAKLDAAQQMSQIETKEGNALDMLLENARAGDATGQVP
ncbi:portal protein [Bdellovibrio bacteriovorus]